MSEEMQAGWDAAIAACLSGHDDCSYGGMTPGSGYWLAAEDCPLNHGRACAWCPAQATTGFAGWGEDGSIWGVPACKEHGAAWAAGHPEWRRDAEPKPDPTWQELLDGLNPFARELAEEYARSVDAQLLGVGPHVAKPELTGFDLLVAVDDALSLWGAGGRPDAETYRQFTRAPTFTGILGFLADEGGRQQLRDEGWSGWLLDLDAPVQVAPAKLRTPKGKRRRRR